MEPSMDGHALRRLFVLANAFKEGDLPVGGTTDDRLRQEARAHLLALTVGDIRRTPLIDDGVTAALDTSRDRRHDAALDRSTIAELKAHLLGPGGGAWAQQHGRALSSETIAALAKVMSNDELSAAARVIVNPHPGPAVTIGSPQHFGSRLQPNSPGDSEQEILFSILEGLTYGCGDVILGINPAADDLDTIVRLEALLEGVVARLQLPTRYCVLSDILKQQAARTRTRVDVAFQSLAGTSRALGGMVGLDADGLAAIADEFDALYFETGQGSAVTNAADEGVDMVTLESRTYGLARHLRQVHRGGSPWLIVNDVAGFIGPEVFSTAAQLERACLEDAMMAKLHGLTIGLDVCATFHMGIAPAELRRLTAAVTERAAPAYLMAVAGNADPMLGYLTTSFREHPDLRRRCGRQITTAMQQRLHMLGALADSSTAASRLDRVSRLYAVYAQAGGDGRSDAALEAEGRRQLLELRSRGFDLGTDPSAAEARLDAIYTHARAALYATLDDGAIASASEAHVRLRTTASTRDEYLARPATGEALRDDAVRALAQASGRRGTQVQFVVSDGLNAHAVNEQIRAVLPALRRACQQRGWVTGTVDAVVENGRVRAGYEIGGIVDAELVVHLIGERPGTGLNTLSAYLTYGRDGRGLPRWSRTLDHSQTTAVCGIHPKGKPPAAAVDEITGTMARILEQRCSGVTLPAATRPHDRRR